MSAKSTRHRHNKKDESRLLDRDLIEQRALQISRDEGRDVISQEDRQRAETELYAPNEIREAPEITPGMESQVTAWDEAPASSGHQVTKIEPEDEASIDKDLVEKGLRTPQRDRRGNDPLLHGRADQSQ